MPQADATSPPRGRLLGASGASAGPCSVGNALRRGISVLSESTGSARADALILLAHVLGRSREWIVAHDDARLSEGDLALFTDLCARRRQGEPVAYITGSACFYGREFIVDESVLVPRPETEHLVDEAVAFLRGLGTAGRVLDVGTGSGAIACTIAAETNAVVDATDVSPEAVALAARNAERLAIGGRCRFLCGDLAAPVKGERYDVVVANLPYVPTADLPAGPDSTSFEPRVALDGGPDGLTVYRALLRGIADHVTAKAMVLLEAAPPTIERLIELTQNSLRNSTVTIGNDYAGLARYVKGTLK
ncbi:MAG TPA: peptide chain release factor N(5)-glutamine methyltransferase [Candidatus Binatia bacterium]|nr:peptide chain release factor N(5)-glutamine methyltransferase [Candidatus Binatia bacterium]